VIPGGHLLTLSQPDALTKCLLAHDKEQAG
jgi:hypothetical protein